MTPAEAITTLTKAFKGDDDYAWCWHCNLAMNAFDHGLDYKRCNEAAAAFMRLAFDVDTSKNEHYKRIMETC